MDMLFDKEQMTGVTFCFFVDACQCGGFIECCRRHARVFRGNSIIVCTSCRADQAIPRNKAPTSGGKKSEAMTSQFTRALMSVLDEGWTNCKISDIEKKLHLRFPIESEVQISQPGPGCSLRIPDVLRRPAMFRWYEFDKARFCSDYWDAATKTPFAMTGKESFMS